MERLKAMVWSGLLVSSLAVGCGGDDSGDDGNDSGGSGGSSGSGGSATGGGGGSSGSSGSGGRGGAGGSSGAGGTMAGAGSGGTESTGGSSGGSGGGGAGGSGGGEVCARTAAFDEQCTDLDPERTVSYSCATTEDVGVFFETHTCWGVTFGEGDFPLCCID